MLILRPNKSVEGAVMTSSVGVSLGVSGSEKIGNCEGSNANQDRDRAPKRAGTNLMHLV
jgi:hypothetical protein